MTAKRGYWLSFTVIILLCGLALCIASLSQPRSSGPRVPIEGIPMLGGLGFLLISGILFFFRPPKVHPEILRDQLTADHVRLVTEHTSIVFPSASRLVGLCHQGTSMSACVATKFEIPDPCREEFMQNAIFQVGIERAPHYELGSHTAWWQRKRLKSRIARVQYLPCGTYVECSLGLENGVSFAYVSWA